MALTQVQGGMLAGSTNTTTTIQSNGTTAITIDSTQKVGIGTASPSYKLHVADGYGFFSGANYGVILGEDNCLIAGTSATLNSANMVFYTANNERMRIFSTGQVAIGTNNFNTGFGGAFTVLASTSNGSTNGIQALTSTGSYALVVANTNGSAGNLVYWAYNGTNVGTVSTNGSSTSYNTTSDYRLKENVAPMTGALATVAQLKPVTYTWKSNGSDGQGFIAHELQAVVPDAVSGEKDAIETYKDEDGNEQTRPKYQGVDTSFLVATLTAAIQELKAELDATKAEVAALKAA